MGSGQLFFCATRSLPIPLWTQLPKRPSHWPCLDPVQTLTSGPCDPSALPPCPRGGGGLAVLQRILRLLDGHLRGDGRVKRCALSRRLSFKTKGRWRGKNEEKGKRGGGGARTGGVIAKEAESQVGDG